MPTNVPPPRTNDPQRPADRRRGLFDRFGDLLHLSLRDTLITGIPVIALLAGVGYFAARFVRPAPPSTIVMTVGREGVAYDEFAKRYREILKRNGITLELHRSSGAVENYERLRKDG